MQSGRNAARCATAMLAGIVAILVGPQGAIAAGGPFDLLDLNHRPTACDHSFESQHVEAVGDDLYFITEASCDVGLALWRARQDGSRRRILHRFRGEDACAQILAAHAGTVWLAVGRRDAPEDGGDCDPRELWAVDSSSGRVEPVTRPEEHFRSLAFVGDRAVAFTTSGAWSTDGSASGTFPIDVEAGSSLVGRLAGTLLLFDGLTLRRTTGRDREAPEFGRCAEPDALRAIGAIGDRWIHACGADLWSLGASEPVARLVLGGPEGGALLGTAASQSHAWLAMRSGTGDVLWASDGTADGTVAVFEADDAVVRWIVGIGHRAVFTVERDGATELWGSDGTAGGTARLARPSEETGSLLPPQPMGDVAVALVHISGTPRETWITDGTPSGTYTLAPSLRPQLRVERELVLTDADHRAWVLDLDTRAATETGTRPLSFFAVAGTPYAIGPDDLGFSTLWRLGADGAVPISVLGARWGTFARTPTVTPTDHAYFWVSDELWRSDGSTAGTRALLSLEAPTESSDPDVVWPLGDRGVFTTTPPVRNNEYVSSLLWMTDGTPEGTEPLVAADADGFVALRRFVVGQEGIYFVRGQRIGRVTLDGRSLQEEHLAVRSDPGESAPVGVEVGGALVAWGCEGDVGSQTCGLYRIDFDAGPPTLLFPRDGVPPVVGGAIGSLLGDRAVFTTSNALVATDGTPEGTETLATLPPHACDTHETFVITVAGRVFASCPGWPSPTGWWATEGTPETTRPMEPFPVPPSLWHAGETAAFFLHGGALFHTDGTSTGTREVLAASDIGTAVTIGDTLYFLRNSDVWTSDGTPEGTRSLGLPPWKNLRVVGGRLVSASHDRSFSIWDPATPGVAPETLPLPGDVRHPWLMGAVGDSFLVSVETDRLGREVLFADVAASVGGVCRSSIEQDAPRTRVLVRKRADTGRALWSISTALRLSPAELQTLAPEAGGLRVTVSTEDGPILDRLLVQGSGHWRTRPEDRRWSFRSGPERVSLVAREAPDGSFRLAVRARFEWPWGLPELDGAALSLEVSSIVGGEPAWCTALPATCAATSDRLTCR